MNLKHGQRHTKLYGIWRRIKEYCYREKSHGFPGYGGRGITMCDKWKDDFAAFAADVGQKPFPDAQLDRIDNDGNYEPGNVRWTTRKVQANNRRSSRWLEWDGQVKTVQEWGEHFDIDPQKIRNRLRRGWAVPEVFSTEDNRRKK